MVVLRVAPRLAALAILACLSFASTIAADTNPYLRAHIDSVEASSDYEIAGGTIVAGDLIASFYEQRAFQPVWLGTPSGQQLLEQIAESPEHGFRPGDFHAALLDRLGQPALAGNAQAAADYEIVATDAAARLIHHLFGGKVDAASLDPDWNFPRSVLGSEPARLLADAVAQDDFAGLVERMAPKHPQYEAMRAALAEYDGMAARGGWPAVPTGDVLKPGASDPRVPVLRQRLADSGDFEGGPSDNAIYDSQLETAVRTFQRRHGLSVDGVIGQETLRVLNVPIETRIDQLRLSLERARWIIRGLGPDFVFVNIAAAETLVVQAGERVWSTRSIVGQQYRKTPVFRDEITYMELNPTWTVPTSIFLRDKLPKIREDFNYLDNGRYSVVDFERRPIDPKSVDWSLEQPPVMLVQEPGPHNALGQVKFMFPNKFAVYLHDTDDRNLFTRAGRNLSSGCVRIEDPFVFADLLMRDAPQWTPALRDSILASGDTTRIDLPTPMPILITYYTAWVEEGMVMFRDDIYERDGVLLEALNSPFVR